MSGKQGEVGHLPPPLSLSFLFPLLLPPLLLFFLLARTCFNRLAINAVVL
jgi:hypothetical protein